MNIFQFKYCMLLCITNATRYRLSYNKISFIHRRLYKWKLLRCFGSFLLIFNNLWNIYTYCVYIYVVWHGTVIIIFTRDCHKCGTAVTIAVCVFVCLQTVRTGLLSSSWGVIDAEWHHGARTASVSLRTWGGLWKSASREWATERLNKVTRWVLSLSSDLYCQIRGGEFVCHLCSPSVTKWVISIKHRKLWFLFCNLRIFYW
jgi:hypothetical protein